MNRNRIAASTFWGAAACATASLLFLKGVAIGKSHKGKLSPVVNIYSNHGMEKDS